MTEQYLDPDQVAKLRANIGRRVREAREHANVSRPALATKLALSYSAIAMWETGKRFPTLPDLYSMASIFRIDLSDLLPNQPHASSARDAVDIIKLAMQTDEARVRDNAHRELEAAARRFLQVTHVTENFEIHEDGSISFSRTGRRKSDPSKAIVEKPLKAKRAA